MKLKPLYDRILVHILDDEATTSGGLFIPQVALSEMQGRGVVIAVGTGRVSFDGRIFPLTVKVGDIVQFARGNALAPAERPQSIPYDGYDDLSVVMMRETIVVGIVTDLKRDTGLLGADNLPALADVEPAAVDPS